MVFKGARAQENGQLLETKFVLNNNQLNGSYSMFSGDESIHFIGFFGLASHPWTTFVACRQITASHGKEEDAFLGRKRKK